MIQSKILTPVATFMVDRGVMEGGTVEVGMKDQEFVFDVMKSARASKPRRKKTAATTSK